MEARFNLQIAQLFTASITTENGGTIISYLDVERVDLRIGTAEIAAMATVDGPGACS